MWAKLILSLLLVQCLAAHPAPELDDQISQEWSAEKTCLDVTKSASFENQNDPTCGSYVFCYVLNGEARPLISTCKESLYYDATLHYCSATKPQGCI
ncbi:uncharacterized protein LOC111073476 [Drosophila obscura]|uniref:uncharacterized protein LOC111073476 n=1 Tax=Drosophila obscura TaxID=7282 RepID=UPI000B9FBF19|nr:uncharacterized protein LOC111073476 [Drosophila obscura]